MEISRLLVQFGAKARDVSIDDPPRRQRSLWTALVAVRRFVCGLRGHHRIMRFERNRILLRCFECGKETAGWAIDLHEPLSAGARSLTPSAKIAGVHASSSRVTAREGLRQQAVTRQIIADTVRDSRTEGPRQQQRI